MAREPTDEDLLARSLEHGEAFGLFYDRFEREVLRFYVRATGRGDLAADLTAETFATALASRRRFDPQLGSARGWLFGIARHLLADAWERRRVEDAARRRLGLEPLVLSDQAIERIEELETERPLRAMRMLAALPDDQRVAITGHVIENRSYEDLARELACSESVVRQRVSRGLRRLRTRLKEMS